MMNHKEIQNLKSILSGLVKHNCNLHCPDFEITGKIVGVGFKPYGTNPMDSKIEKLEFNFIDAHGRIIPFYLYNVIGYDILSRDGNNYENTKNLSLEIHLFAPDKVLDAKPYNKVRLDIISNNA